MARVMTFATRFPKGHIREGQSTDFPNKILIGEKKHTIRGSFGFNAGDMFSPRFWTDMPYRSPMEVISNHMQIKRVEKIIIYPLFKEVYITDWSFKMTDAQILELAKNDGLDIDSFWSWFGLNKCKQFLGQLRIWDETGLTY